MDDNKVSDEVTVTVTKAVSVIKPDANVSQTPDKGKE